MNEDKKVRLGIVGLSGRGQSYIETCMKAGNCQVTAFCDKYEHLVAKGMRKAKDPGIRTYTDYEKMLKEAPMDAVFLIVAPEDNTRMILRALEAGKHVMCEVPLAYSMEDCWKIVTAVEKSGLKFQLAEQARYFGWVSACKKMIEQGKLGKVIFAEGEYLHQMGNNRYWVDDETGEWITTEEAKTRKAHKSRMWNLLHHVWYSPHEVSPLLSLLDDRVKSVTAMTTRSPSYRLDWFPISDIDVALLHTEKDVIIRLAQSFTIKCRRGGEHNYRVIGTEGRFEQDIDKPFGMVLTADHYKTISMMGRDYKEIAEYDWSNDPSIQGEEEKKIMSYHGHFGRDYFPVATFINSIVNDEQPPVDVYKAVEIAAPAILAGQSIEQGSVCLTVPEFRPNAKRKAGTMPASLSDLDLRSR